MNDLEEYNSYPSSSALAKQGLAAVGYIAGGVFLFVLQAISRLRGLGLVAGALVCVVGLVSLLSKNQADRKPGAFITAAGALVVLSKTGIRLLTVTSGTLLSIGAIGLLAVGVLNGIRFLKGLKKRS